MLVAVAAGILTFVWPGITLHVVAILLAWYLIIFGVMHLISALAGPKVSYWWTQLLLGVAELVLGVWAVRSWQWSLLTLLTLVGVWAIFYGWPRSSPHSLYARPAGGPSTCSAESRLDPAIAHRGIGDLVAHADREGDVGKVAVRGSLRPIRVAENDAPSPDPMVRSAQRSVDTVLTTVRDSTTASAATPISNT